MTSRHRFPIRSALGTLALISLGCSREAPTTPELVDSDPVAPALSVGQVQESSGDLPVTERFQVSVRAQGDIRVGSPLALTLDVAALHTTEAVEIALQVPELEQLTATGSFRGILEGRRDNPSFVWRGKLAAGQRISRTVQLQFPRAGYYTVVGTARKISTEMDTSWVSSGASDILVRTRRALHGKVNSRN
jgi:hypothetical protein